MRWFFLGIKFFFPLAVLFGTFFNSKMTNHRWS
jgi:hypothetical protein